MRMLLSALALLLGASAAPPVSIADNQPSASALPPGRHLYAFRCPHYLLRVVFDGDHNVATIHFFGRPPVTLSRRTSAGEGFHFSNARYDLQGTYGEVRFRVGQAEAARCARNSVDR